MFRRVLSGRSVSWGAVVFDAPGPTFRHAIDSEYKAQRPPVPSELAAQFEPIDRLVAGFGFPVLRVAGVEADDVIGTLARRAEASGDDVLIVSGDKDFCQLVSPSITLLEPLRDVTMDTEWVRKRWGVRPDQFADVLAMMGDSVDNIPGVPGIGAKGAAKLLGQFDSLQGILDNVQSLKGRQKTALVEHADQARRSLELATIRTDVAGVADTADLAIRDLPDSALRDLFTEFEFFSLMTEAPKSEVTTEVVELSDLSVAEVFLAGLDASVVGVVVVTSGPSAVRGSTLGLALAQERVGWLDLRCPSPGRDRIAQWLADPESSVVVCGLRDALSALSLLAKAQDGA
jgi:DNA polymerase-1